MLCILIYFICFGVIFITNLLMAWQFVMKVQNLAMNSLTLACSNSKLEKDTKIQNICNSLSVVLDSLLHAEQSVTSNIEPLLSVESMVNNLISTGRKKLGNVSSRLYFLKSTDKTSR